ANPKYIVSGSSNPAGLVDTLDGHMTIPVAWSITAGTNTAVVSAPAAADPTNTSDPNSYPWQILKDANTPNIPSQNTTAFAPGDLSVVVKNNVGIHYQAGNFLGAENPPNYVYLEANFGAALALHNYQTSRLI